MIIPAAPKPDAGLIEYQQTRIAGLIHQLARADAGLPVAAERRDEVTDYRRSISDLTGLAAEIIGRIDTRAAQSSSDFAAAVSDGLSLLLADTYTPALATLQSLARAMPVADFKAHDLVTAELPELTETFAEDGPPTWTPITTRTISGARLRVFECSLKVSRQVFETFGAALVAAVSGLSRELMALEMRLLAEALQAVPLDGSNSTAGPTPAAGALSLAIDALETQALRPCGIFCGTGAAWSLRAALKLIDLAIPVITLPDLPAAYTYVVCDPAARPAVLRLHESDPLPGAPMPSIGWQRVKRGQAIGYYCRHCVGYMPADSRGLYFIPGVG